METYRQTIEHNQSKNSKIRTNLFLVLGIVNLILSILNYIKYESFGIHEIMFTLNGIMFIIFYVFQKNNSNNSYFIELNSSGIGAKLSFNSSLQTKWNDIKEIDIKPISISFELTSGEKEEISLGSFSYANVIEFKSKIKEFASEKGISII